MISISSHVDGHSIAADIRMQRQVHKGSFALVEGATDFKRFRSVISETKCCIVICYGKSNVVNAVELLYGDGFPGAVGFVDQDFDVILGKSVSHEGLVYSSFHDFDVDVLSTSALQRYLNEVVDLQKLPPDWYSKSVLDAIIDSIRPLAILRFCNIRARLNYKLTDLAVEEFFYGLTINRDVMIRCVFRGYNPCQQRLRELRDLVEKCETLSIDPYQLTSGHDLCAALGVKLRTQIGHRKIPQTYRSEIELHLRLAVTMDDLARVGLIRKITEWKKLNPPYEILA